MNPAEVGVGMAMGQAQENQSGSGHGHGVPREAVPLPASSVGPRPALRGEGESGSRDATLGARCCHVSPLSFPTMSVYPLGSQIND